MEENIEVSLQILSSSSGCGIKPDNGTWYIFRCLIDWVGIVNNVVICGLVMQGKQWELRVLSNHLDRISTSENINNLSFRIFQLRHSRYFRGLHFITASSVFNIFQVWTQLSCEFVLYPWMLWEKKLAHSYKHIVFWQMPDCQGLCLNFFIFPYRINTPAWKSVYFSPWLHHCEYHDVSALLISGLALVYDIMSRAVGWL